MWPQDWYCVFTKLQHSLSIMQNVKSSGFNNRAVYQRFFPTHQCNLCFFGNVVYKITFAHNCLSEQQKQVRKVDSRSARQMERMTAGKIDRLEWYIDRHYRKQANLWHWNIVNEWQGLVCIHWSVTIWQFCMMLT